MLISYPGHWVELRASPPLGLVSRAMRGKKKALRKLFRLAVARWSFSGAVPTGTECLPWDLMLEVALRYQEPWHISDDEDGELLMRATTHDSCLSIPELDRFNTCCRLSIPYGSKYEALPAGQTLRLLSALSAQDEIEAEWAAARASQRQ